LKNALRREIAKYECSFYTRSHGKLTSPWGKSQWDSRGLSAQVIFSKQDGSRYSQVIKDVNKVEEKKEETDLKV
jgi:hypothetical protein